MNYTSITIDGQKIGLKFGMASFRYLTDKLVEGVSFDNNELNEIGIGHILYGGYTNNCLVKGVLPEFTFEYFVDTIEKNLINDEFLNQIKEVIKVWTESDFIKQAVDISEAKEQPKKKTSRGKK
jgi:hypothetical protein